MTPGIVNRSRGSLMELFLNHPLSTHLAEAIMETYVSESGSHGSHDIM